MMSHVISARSATSSVHAQSRHQCMIKSAREITTSELGELVLEYLYKFDKVAYIRFASAYKHFESLEEFITEVKNVEGHKK